MGISKKGEYFLGKILDDFASFSNDLFWFTNYKMGSQENCCVMARLHVFCFYILFLCFCNYGRMSCYSLMGMHWNYVLLLFLCCMLFIEVIQPLMIQKKKAADWQAVTMKSWELFLCFKKWLSYMMLSLFYFLFSFSWSGVRSSAYFQLFVLVGERDAS